jgi:endonuclease/exonuclease/phosphatase (EEP) superfamily protein YafD
MRLLRVLGWLVLLTGLVLQLWLKDRDVRWALLFYGMPKPCLAGLALGIAFLSRRRIRQAGLALACAVAILIWWVSTSWCVPLEAKPNDAQKVEVTVLYWNLCRPPGLDQEMVDLVHELQPHLAAFVEPGPQVSSLLEKYESLLPGYSAQWMPRGILWLNRVPSGYRERGKLDRIGAFARFDVEGFGAAFPIVVADVYPHLSYSRRPQLQDVLTQAQGRSDAILLGDFNTPLESVHLTEYRKDFVEAFEVAGSGFKETWPCGLPLLSIDHIWVGADWEVVEARKIWRLTGSDHAALFVKLRRK